MFSDQTLRVVKSSLTCRSPMWHHSRTLLLPPSLSSLLSPCLILTFSPSFPIHKLECPFLWSSRGDGSSFSWSSQGDWSWFYLKFMFNCSWHGSTWSFYLIVRGSISNSYDNFFMCASGGPHWGTLFLLFLCCACSCSYFAFVVHALVLVALMFCTCSYYTFITCTPILDMFMLCNCSCCSSIVNALVFVLPLLQTCFCCTSIVRALIFIALLLRSWPSYTTTLSCSLTFDLFVLLPCTAFQFMTLLHWCVMLFLSYWPSCVVVLCCFSIFDHVTLLQCFLAFDPFTLVFSF